METEETAHISGRPSHRPFTACGSFATKADASTAAAGLSAGAQSWEAIQVESTGRKMTGRHFERHYAIRRTA